MLAQSIIIFLTLEPIEVLNLQKLSELSLYLVFKLRQFIIFFENIMEIFRAVKNSQVISPSFATLLISSLEIQIIGLFLIQVNASIYGDIAEFMRLSYSLPLLVIINFFINFMEIIFLLVGVLTAKPNQNNTKTVSKSAIIRCLQFKHYFTIIQILTFNTLAIKQETNLIKALAFFNIFFILFELYALKIIRISYRFVENNFLRKKNSTIIPCLLIIPIIISINQLPVIYSCFFLIFRAIVQFKFNFHDLENETLRSLLWFYPLMQICLSIMIFVDDFANSNLFNSSFFSTFILVFSAYCCQCLAKTIDFKILRLYINNSSQLFEGDKKTQNSEDTQKTQIDDDRANQNIMQLRIMANIFVSRSEYKNAKKLSSSSSSSNFYFDHWWGFFDRFLMNHRIYCKKVHCVCQKIAFGNFSQNGAIEDQVFTEKIYDLIKKIQSQSSDSSVKKLKIIENYFLVEIQNKPFKVYYQLVKLMSDSLTKSEILEVENLMLETRNQFHLIFTKEKVRNSNLQLEPVFQLQAHIKEMRLQMNQMALDYRDFYDIFASNFVKMDSVKAKAQLLTKQKADFSKKFDYCLEKYDKSLGLLTFAMVYFRFFDEYTDQLNVVEKKATLLNELYFSPNNIYKQKKVEVFDPHYGSVKIDLVFKLGKVLSISKNLCHALGFSHRQIEGHKVNKLMPYMFARVHDKFLKNFVQKGSLKILKEKEAIFYSKNANKFIVPIQLKLKIDLSHYDSLCATAFVRPTKSKSQFIIMNNYGKIEQISQGLYRKLFMKSCREDIVKIKKLAMSKMLLSLNYFLRDTSQNNDVIHEGFLLISQSQQILNDYFKFPELSISFKKGDVQKQKSSSRNSQSLEGNTSSSSRHTSLDFSQDMNQYTVDMKQSLKELFKKIDTKNIVGFKVSYKLKDCVTSEFKFKVLEIVSIWQERTSSDFMKALKREVVEVASFFGLQEHQYYKFMENNEEIQTNREEQTKIKQKTSTLHQISISSQNRTEQNKENNFHGIQNQESQGSSVCSVTQIEKTKTNVITAFGSKIIISQNLQYVFAILIFCMAMILIIISAFSITLKGNYIDLQQDNSIITNFRINFLTSLGIQQLKSFYQMQNIPVPIFLAQKKAYIDDKMKQYLIKSTSYIDLSHQDYAKQMNIFFDDKDYYEQQSVLQAFMITYSTFLSSPQRGKYITQNYVNLNNEFLALTNHQEKLIQQKSLQYKSQIDIVVICYSLIMVGIAIVCFFLNKISNKKQNKIIEFLPFFKAHQARKKVRFFQLLFNFNKQSQDIDTNQVAQIQQDLIVQDRIVQIQGKQNGKNKKLNAISTESSSQLIRVLKNDKGKLSPKIKLIGICVFLLCIFVIFYSEFFFSEIHDKFKAYLQLKNSAFLVQLMPARIILLYFININRQLHNQKPILIPQSFETLVHDRIFQLQLDLSSQQFHESEMEILIRDHFKDEICKLIRCDYDFDESPLIYNQNLFYLAYRILNAFDYMRKINDLLPTFADPQVQIGKWMRENNMLEVLKSTQFILDLMKKNEKEISALFNSQIVSIGQTLLAISVTLIPILIVSLLFARNKYMETISNRLESTENVYKHIGWEMLGENTYAVNYFEEKLKMSKTY